MNGVGTWERGNVGTGKQGAEGLRGRGEQRTARRAGLFSHSSFAIRYSLFFLLLSACAAPSANAPRLNPLDQTRLEVAVRLAEDQLAAGKFEQARGTLASLRHLKQDSVQLTQARIDVEEGRYEAALRRLENTAGGAKEPAAAHHLRGVALEGLGRWADAAAAYQKAYTLEPTAQILSAWADMLALTQRVPEARELLARERGRFPGDVALNLLAARIAERSGDWETAIHELNAAILARPDAPEIRRRLAEAHQNAGQPEKAVPLWRELVATTEQANARHHYRQQLAECLTAAGQTKEAQGVYHVLALTQPKDLTAQLGLAVTRLATDEPAAALEAALKILQTEPDNVEARLAAALSYRRLNQTAKAVETLSTLPARQAADPLVPELLARWRQK